MHLVVYTATEAVFKDLKFKLSRQTFKYWFESVHCECDFGAQGHADSQNRYIYTYLMLYLFELHGEN